MPFIYQEVIDMGQGEPITRWDYNKMGRVTEFNYGAKLGFKPFIYQEVIDTGHNEPITHWEYIPMGRVIEFLYGAKLETCPGKDQTSSSSTLETLARVGASFRVETLSLSWTTMITSGVTELAARIY
ncbi:hypothetical protein MRX96_017859 [Rhipicephalus microplus]